MERFVSRHIMNHILFHNISFKNQHGFVPHLSMTTKLLESMDIITGALNKGCGVDIVYLDLIKDFDRVPHAKLIIKLRSVGITDSLLSISDSYYG